MNPRAGALAPTIATSLAPVAGILLLGWSPVAILISYFVDTFLALGGVVLLVMIHLTGNEHGRPIEGVKDWAKALCGLALLGAIMALPMGLPLLFVLGDDARQWALLDEPGFQGALAIQAAMSVYAVVRTHRELVRRSDDDRVLAGRAIFLVARWAVMFVAMVTGFVPALGPVAGSFVLIVVHGAASIYFECFPERAERFLRGKDAKAIVYGRDLDSIVKGAAGGDGARKPQAPKRKR